MTVTAIQIGLDPDVIDYSSPDFARFPGLSQEKLRGAFATPDDIRRWYPNPEAVA
ncbi:hypothetical protein [Mycobacterium sp.]|uniref:hypothetical protein n=1 Tax=Mycobacterium sp. TaxID=1785 RepID=UPI003F9A955D